MKPVHSHIGASSMHRWAACPGSVKLGSGIENRSSEYAAEGTVAHRCMEMVLTDPTISPADMLGTEMIADGFTFTVNQEMVDGINLYVDSVKADYEPGDSVYVEHRFDLSHIHEGLYGTADTVVWKPAQKLLIVKDLKYGAGIAVEAKDNPQLRYYALGALIDLGLPARRVRIEIIQPRCFHPDGPIRSEEMDAIDLMDFATDLVDYALATEADDAPLHAGDHCKFCPAAGICPELRRRAQAAAAQAFEPDLPYDPAQLSAQLHELPILETYIKSVREFAYREAESGRAPPGWKLVEKRATRKWRDEDVTRTWLRENVDPDDSEFVVSKLLTPAAIEKLLSKEHRAALETLCTKESSGHTLAPDSDKRPAAKESASDAFSNV